MKVKICGLKKIEDVLFAIRAGADLIGIVREPSSKRYISLELAQSLAEAAIENGATPVAVYKEGESSRISEECRKMGIDYVQIHQKQVVLPESFSRLYVGEREEFLRDGKDYLLFDGAIAGSGQPFDWESFSIPHGKPWFLAGGLTPENIKEAIKLLQPYGVDVSSGVEKNGIKDHELMRAFIMRAKGYE
jgi:phosphoribosylanthranilate isomerase